MKKIFSLLLIVLLLTACAVKKEDLYQVSFGDNTITVGYDNEEAIQQFDFIDAYESMLNKKKEYTLISFTLYLKDVNEEVLINNYSLKNGLQNTCDYFKGEIVNNNAKACVIHNTVNKKENVVVLYSNLLNDNVDEIDHIEVSYR